MRVYILIVSCEGKTAVVCGKKDERDEEIRYSNAQVSVPSFFFFHILLCATTNVYTIAMSERAIMIMSRFPQVTCFLASVLFFFQNFVVFVASAHYIYAAVTLYYCLCQPLVASPVRRVLQASFVHS